TISGEDKNRTASDPQPVSFLPALLELNISGDPVEPPSEATATPQPTETSAFVPNVTQAAPPTALVNVTIDPNELQSADTPAPTADTSSPLLVIAIGAMVIAAIGLIVVLILWRRTKRK
ncbi:MAG TPA: hypothetical protein VHO69_00950, partial [Phototrophicaceae bacterium]|nr:hypothetical protein [Phototrophicaceae bacterium]